MPLFSPPRHFSTGPTKDRNDGAVETVSQFMDVPGVKTEGDKMVLMFTCTVCDTRSARKISKQAYHHGIVLVRCGGCKNRHLIADRMGVFEDTLPLPRAGISKGPMVGTGWDIQKYLADTREPKLR